MRTATRRGKTNDLRRESDQSRVLRVFNSFLERRGMRFTLAPELHIVRKTSTHFKCYGIVGRQKVINGACVNKALETKARV